MPHQAQSAEAAAEAVAADWACLLWLLQTAPDALVTGLRAEWQSHQLQEFATWVRPAAELSTSRSKTAAKVCALLQACASCHIACWIVQRKEAHKGGST